MPSDETPAHEPFVARVLPRRKLALAPVLGAAFGGLIVVGCVALSANSLLAYFSLGGLVIVLGGVIAVAFMSFPSSDVRLALAAIVAVFQQPRGTHEDLVRDMRNIMEWAQILKESGRRGLEQAVRADELDDPLIRYGLNMVLGDYAPDEVRGMLLTAADAHRERDLVPVEVLHAMTSNAPAFGMVGTLVGMIAMLCNLNDNVAAIGPSLAVAFLSTLYGVISARMIYMPAAMRLRQDVENRAFRCELVAEGIAMLSANRTPSQIQDRLNGYLPPELRDYFNSLVRKETLSLASPLLGVPHAAPPRRPRLDLGALLPQLKAIGL